MRQKSKVESRRASYIYVVKDKNGRISRIRAIFITRYIFWH